MTIKYSDKALVIATDKQKATLKTLENDGHNELEVGTAFELPKGYVSFLLWYGVERKGQPIYGGIDPEGVAST